MQRFLLSFALLLGLLTAAWAQGTPTVSILGTPVEGGAIYVTVRGVSAGASGTVHFANQTFPLSPADDHQTMRTVVPVPVDTGAGDHAMVMDVTGGASLQRTVHVQHRWFSEQHLWIPAATLAQYDTPRNRADDVHIIERLKQFDPVQHWKGSFIMPVIARESTPFGAKRLYNGWYHGWHKGVDLAAEAGTPIKAAAGGVVAVATLGLVNGNTVAINHGLGLGTVYLHMSRFVVHEGDTVARGDIIGYVGGTGGFAPHLHWEARVNGVPIDPHTLLSLPAAWR